MISSKSCRIVVDMLRQSRKKPRSMSKHSPVSSRSLWCNGLSKIFSTGGCMNVDKKKSRRNLLITGTVCYKSTTTEHIQNQDSNSRANTNRNLQKRNRIEQSHHSFDNFVDVTTITDDNHGNNIPLYYLAHMNYARLKYTYDHPDMLEFVNAIEPVNMLAKTSPGFVWAFDNPIEQSVSDESNNTDTHNKWKDYVTQQREMVPILRHDPMLMPQMSLWTDIQSLRHFAFKSGHAMYYKRKREWFTDDIPAPYAVCWWHRNIQYHNNFSSTPLDNHHKVSLSDPTLPTATTLQPVYPTLFEAFERCERLRNDGPTFFAFDFASAKNFPQPKV